MEKSIVGLHRERKCLGETVTCRVFLLKISMQLAGVTSVLSINTGEASSLTISTVFQFWLGTSCRLSVLYSENASVLFSVCFFPVNPRGWQTKLCNWCFVVPGITANCIYCFFTWLLTAVSWRGLLGAISAVPGGVLPDFGSKFSMSFCSRPLFLEHLWFSVALKTEPHSVYLIMDT